MKLSLKILAVILVAACGLFYFFFNTPHGFGMLAKVFLPKRYSISADRIRTNPFDGMEISGLKASGRTNRIQWKLEADWAGLKIDSLFDWTSALVWIENLDIALKGPSFKGEFVGALRLKTHRREVSGLSLTLESVAPGGVLPRPWVKNLLDHLPQIADKSGKSIPYDAAHIVVTNGEKDSFQAKIKIESKDLNANIDTVVDLHLDSDLWRLLGLYRKGRG